MEFYRKVSRLLSVGSVFKNAKAVYSQVPSFGRWGYVIASDTPLKKQRTIPSKTRYVTDDNWQFVLEHPNDLPPLELPVNRLQTLHLMQLYAERFEALREREWGCSGPSDIGNRHRIIRHLNRA